MAVYFHGLGPDALSNVMLNRNQYSDPDRQRHRDARRRDYWETKSVCFIPPHLVQASIDALAGAKARDEWMKMKMDIRQYKISPATCTCRWMDRLISLELRRRS